MNNGYGMRYISREQRYISKENEKKDPESKINNNNNNNKKQKKTNNKQYNI